MDKRRLLQMAELVVDANNIFRKTGMNNVSMEVSQHPEILIRAHWNGTDFQNTYRYRATSPLLHDKLDPNFDAAEHRIRELMEEVRNDTVRDD